MAKAFKFYDYSAKHSKPASPVTTSKRDSAPPDAEAEMRELAQNSHSEHRFGGLKALVSDPGKLNHANYTLAHGYDDGSVETTEAGERSRRAEDSAQSSQATKSSYEDSGRPTSGKSDSRAHLQADLDE
jgi:hypothetical protein